MQAGLAGPPEAPGGCGLMLTLGRRPRRAGVRHGVHKAVSSASDEANARQLSVRPQEKLSETHDCWPRALALRVGRMAQGGSRLGRGGQRRQRCRAHAIVSIVLSCQAFHLRPAAAAAATTAHSL